MNDRTWPIFSSRKAGPLEEHQDEEDDLKLKLVKPPADVYSLAKERSVTSTQPRKNDHLQSGDRECQQTLSSLPGEALLLLHLLLVSILSRVTSETL